MDGIETLPLGIAPLSRIHVLCEQYRRHWAAPSAASRGTYVAQAPQELRETLLRNLLHIDLQCRREAGEQPSTQNYLDDLPQFARIIREELHETTQHYVTCGVDTVSLSGSGPPKLKMPALLRLGDYVLEGELGRGGMGIVFAARHVRHGTQVALKTLPTVNALGLQKFKQEFRSLAGINHPNLIGLHRLQSDAGQWFFTMDLINGTDFRTYVRPSGQLDLVRLRESLAQLVSGVQALHGHKIVHRDLKPSNVMVSEDGRVQLLDFGLVVNFSQLADSGEEVVVAGTPAYMAPEQFHGEVTPAADWYSVGIMLYEALAGRLPFAGSTTQIFRAKQHQDPPSLSAAIPQDLAGLCRALLSRHPDDRPVAADILVVLGPVRNQPSSGARTGASAERLIGRDVELHRIDQVIATWSEQPSAKVILISGRSGEGKTILAEHFLERFRLDPTCTVFVGRCYDRESVPFKAVDMMIDALCNRLSAMADRKVRDLLTNEIAVLAELFPVLNRVREIASLPRLRLEHLELHQVRRLATGALRNLLCRLCESSKLVCFIDDLQWGDARSAELLLDVLTGPGAPGVLQLGTYRSDEAESSNFLQAWNVGREKLVHDLPQFDCQLQPLSQAECIDLVIDLVGEDSALIRERAAEMTEETGGNPFLLAELARCYDPHSPSIQATQMEELLERKLLLLPAEARALLNVVVVSGYAIAADEATKSAGHHSVPLSTLTRMRSERLLRMVGDDEHMMIDTYHDRIRETVLRDMETSTRTALPVQLAESIIALSAAAATSPDPVGAASDPRTDSRTDSRVYDLAYHFYEAGDDRAFSYLLEAAEASMQAYAMDNAIGHFEKAARTIPDDCDTSTRYRLWERMGQACGKANRMHEAVEHYQTAGTYASGPVERATALSGIGDLRNRMGEFDQSIVAFDDALHELGYSRSKRLPWILAETSWLATLCHILWIVRPHRRDEHRQRAEIAAEIYHNISLVVVYSRRSKSWIASVIRFCGWFFTITFVTYTLFAGTPKRKWLPRKSSTVSSRRFPISRRCVGRNMG